MSDGQRATDGTDERPPTTDGAKRPMTDGGAPERRTVDVPERVDFPRLLDFYDLQDAEHTRIHGFYDNLREGQLTTTQCGDCDAVHFPPRVVCPECHGDDLSYADLPHRGELFAFTEVRGAAPIGMDDDVPFVVAVVDLGPVRLSARIEDAGYDDLSIGDAVELVVVELDDATDEDRVFYRFRPADASDD